MNQVSRSKARLGLVMTELVGRWKAGLVSVDAGFQAP